MQREIKKQRFRGREFSTKDIILIQEIAEIYSKISLTEISNTVCELLEWKRPSGKLKTIECQEFLELLETKRILKLPKKKTKNSNGLKQSAKIIKFNENDKPYSKLTGSVESFLPLEVEQVQTKEQRQIFKDLMSRYHYLGYAMPFGARLQYFVYVSHPQREIVGCVQFSSPAWRMKARDKWVGWNDKRREAALQQVVNNSRFLILARIKNLASSVLSATLQKLRSDWEKQYCITPLLVETLVDRKKYYGGCYRASNWLELGETSGRGRMDRENKRHGAQVKTVLVYPLVKNARRILRDGI